MRQSIRALSWTITISSVLVFAFLVTAVYSLTQTILLEQGVQFDDFQVGYSDNSMILSAPISINNTSYFDITQLQIFSTLNNDDGRELTTATQLITKIRTGTVTQVFHNVTLQLDAILASASVLLFEDTEFTIDFRIDFWYASALGFQIGLVNMSIPWGAPLHGLNFTGIEPLQYNGTHLVTNCTLEFENHSFLDVNGTLRLTAYNHADEYVGGGVHVITVVSHSQLSAPFEVALFVENPTAYSGSGTIQVELDLPGLGYRLNLGSLSYG